MIFEAAKIKGKPSNSVIPLHLSPSYQGLETGENSHNCFVLHTRPHNFDSVILEIWDIIPPNWHSSCTCLWKSQYNQVFYQPSTYPFTWFLKSWHWEIYRRRIFYSYFQFSFNTLRKYTYMLYVKIIKIKHWKVRICQKLCWLWNLYSTCSYVNTIGI